MNDIGYRSDSSERWVPHSDERHHEKNNARPDETEHGADSVPALWLGGGLVGFGLLLVLFGRRRRA